MNRPRVRSLALLAVSVVLVSACSGDDDTTAATSAPSVAPTTAAPGTTTAPETTLGPDTTVPRTTAAPTTVPPTVATTTELAPATTAPPDTTLPEGVPPRVTFPDDPEKQAVVDAFYAYDDALNAALRDPTNGLLVAELLATVGEPQTERVSGFVDGLAEANEVSVIRPERPGYAEVYEFTVFTSGSSATLDACVVDTDLLIVPGGLDDGSDLVLDESITSFVDTYTLRLIEGAWVVADASRVGKFEGQYGCE